MLIPACVKSVLVYFFWLYFDFLLGLHSTCFFCHGVFKTGWWWWVALCVYEKRKEKKRKEGNVCTLSQLGDKFAFDTFFTFILHHYYFTLFAGLCWVLFSVLFFVRLGLIGFAGGRRSFRIRGFHLLSGVFCLRHMRGRWGPGTGFRGLMIFHLGCKPIKGFLMLPGYWDRVRLVLLLLLSS